MSSDYKGMDKLSLKIERKVQNLESVEKAVDGTTKKLRDLDRTKIGQSIRKEARRAARAAHERNQKKESAT